MWQIRDICHICDVSDLWHRCHSWHISDICHKLSLLYFLLSDKKSLNSNSYSKTYRYPHMWPSHQLKCRGWPVTLHHSDHFETSNTAMSPNQVSGVQRRFWHHGIFDAMAFVTPRHLWRHGILRWTRCTVTSLNGVTMLQCYRSLPLKENGTCDFTYTDTILTALILHILFKPFLLNLRV